MTEALNSRSVEERAGELTRRFHAVQNEIGRRILGQSELIEALVIAHLAGGHVLLEGLPGLGKTELVHCLAASLGLQFSRIQFTPDLMPADVTGTRIVEERGSEGLAFRFQKGPLFANLVLADEINRTTPKTQSALLEAMQERTVTVGDSTYPLPSPFAVVATQNPIELEGTYPLPEAQLDRFMFHLTVETPAVDDMVRILGQTTAAEQPELRSLVSGDDVIDFQAFARQVLCGEHLLRYVAELLRATHPDDDDADPDTRRLVRYGASPRAGQSIVLAAKARALLDGRPSVSREDLDWCTLPALRHRIILTFEAEAESKHVADLLPNWRKIATARSE